MVNRFRKRFPYYPDDTDYTTNSPSYYDDLARKNKLIRLLAEKIWEYEKTLDLTLEEINQRLTAYINENDELMNKRLEEWDLRLEKFPENVELLLQEWLEDGTLDHIINETIFSWKADKDYVDNEFEELNLKLDLKDEKLSNQFTQNKMFEGQVDFVDMVRDRTTYNSMRVKKSDNPYEAISVFLINGNNHISYDFKKNVNDDFWIFNTAYTGKLKTSEIYYETTASKTGNWSELSGANRFTTEVGATFTVNIKGERIELQHPTDNRGGLFKIVINNDVNSPVIVSTYSEDFEVTSTLIAEGLDPESTHRIVGEFIGDDPNNPPEGGNSRGWIRDSTGNPRNYTVIGGFIDNGSYLDNTMMLGYGSNKEFALNFEVDGERYWFPEHNNVGTAFEIDSFKLILDGKQINLDDMELNRSVLVDNLQFVQKVVCRFPNVSNDLAELEITHNINKNGVVSIIGKVKFLTDVFVRNGYTMMLPLVQDTIKQLVSSIGGSLTSKGDESLTYFNEEMDRTHSFAGVDDRNPDYITAMSFDYPLKTLRYGKEGRGDINNFFYYHERKNYPKLYALIFNDYNAKKDEVYKFSGRYVIGQINNIQSYIGKGD